jgi:hypothetical protein
MAYTRKTRDVWRFYVNYGHGWEHEHTDLTRAEKDVNKKAYAKDCGFPFKIVKGRDKIDEVGQ